MTIGELKKELEKYKDEDLVAVVVAEGEHYCLLPQIKTITTEGNATFCVIGAYGV